MLAQGVKVRTKSPKSSDVGQQEAMGLHSRPQSDNLSGQDLQLQNLEYLPADLIAGAAYC